MYYNLNLTLSYRRNNDLYSINEVEKMYGLKASTLRFYEKEGILPKINRDSGGRRKYTEQELEWIQLVLALRSTGMTIEELKEYMGLIRKGSETLEERRELLLKHKANVEERMAETLAHLEKINKKVAIYDITIHQKNGGTFLM